MKLCCGRFRRGQFICRETCCFVHWARENILQAKKWLRPFSWRSHLFFSLFRLYFNERIYECGDKLMHSKKEAKFLLKMNLYLYL